MNSFFSPEFLKKYGISEFAYTEESKPSSFAHFKTWVEEKNYGILGYLSDHRKNLRSDIKNIFPEFQSALVFLFPYEGARKDADTKVASYAFAFEGRDYHLVLRERLDQIATQLKEEYGEFNYQLSIDMQPVLERDLAYRAGLGWFGKNSMLIHRKHGSFFLIASILLDKKLNLKRADIETDHCGHCTACIDACPTRAIDPVNRTVNAAKCISTFTIEQFKEADPPYGYEKSRGEIFGCDICQDVCPWNSKPVQNSNPVNRGALSSFFSRSHSEIAKEVASMSNGQFKKFFFGTVFFRTGKRGLLKNFKTWLAPRS